MAARTNTGFAPFRTELSALRAQVRNPTSPEERRAAVERMAEINREVHEDTYERLRHK